MSSSLPLYSRTGGAVGRGVVVVVVVVVVDVDVVLVVDVVVLVDVDDDDDDDDNKRDSVTEVLLTVVGSGFKVVLLDVYLPGEVEPVSSA